MSNLQSVIDESFTIYAGAVLQSRALVDVRDCLKPSARQIFYCLETDKLVHNKPFNKTLKALGSASRMYIHGDASCIAIMMRAAQPFSMRYPLVEVEGSYGNLMESGNWAAPRYTGARLSGLTSYLFKDVKKDTIKEWKDNYDDTERYPMVLPTKGYYNIVNPTMGIGVGAACSIPGFNLKEVNEALIKLLWNPDISFEEIYCAPDMPTGGILLNEEEVKESLKDGYGKSCKIRSVIEYDSKDRCLIVTEIPYSVYTNTICRELEEILNGDDNPGIDRFNDLTGERCLIKIYLSKKANANKILKYLYKNTSLQSYFGINMTMLEDGRYPKTFGWKEALQAHINHEIEVYTRGYEFDARKIKDRIHIIDGLLIAMANIDEVVHTIKSSASTAAASLALQKNFLLDEAQTKAILDMKLSRLAHLEVQKLENEKTELEKELEKIMAILNDKNLLKKEIEKGLKEVANKFGDARRTQILNVEKEEDETIEQKSVQVSLTNQNNIYVAEISNLYTQRRGGVGSKFKLNKGEYVISTTSGQNTDTILFFTNNGNSYHYQMSVLPMDEKIPIETLIKISDSEKVCALVSTTKKNTCKYIVFFTKNGIVKKSKVSEYITNRTTGLKAINLDSDDVIRSALIMDEEPVCMMTEQGNFVIIETKNISAIGRVAKGRKAIKLNAGDYLICAKPVVGSPKEILSISKEGYAKRTLFNEFGITGLNTKGTKVQKFKTDSDKMIDFELLDNENGVIAVSSTAQIKVNLSDIALLSKSTIGNKLIKMTEKARIIGISKI